MSDGIFLKTVKRGSQMTRILKVWPKSGATGMMILLVACSTRGHAGRSDCAGPARAEHNRGRELAHRHNDRYGASGRCVGGLDRQSGDATGRPGGENNCTFPFGQDVPQWDFHPDAGCWEHSGPDGWVRNQQQKIHIPNFSRCGGGPGDANVIRVCRLGGAGQPQPCFLDPSTGPNGCARCVVNPTCH